jgi:pectinesterase
MMLRKTTLLAVLFFCSTGKSFAQTSNPQQYKYVFTVAKDGSGDYKFIQDAIDAMRAFPLAPITLYIKNGVYNEKIELPSYNTDVTFIGERDKTIITFNDYSGRAGSIFIYRQNFSNRFVAENITFANSADQVG